MSVASMERLANGFGSAPGDTPLLLRNNGNQQIYAPDWDAP